MSACAAYLTVDVIGGCFLKLKAATVRHIKPARKRHQVTICYSLGAKHGRNSSGRMEIAEVTVKGDARRIQRKLARILEAG